MVGRAWRSLRTSPNYSSSVSTTAPLTPGLFSITLATIADPSRHVQYGFETIGPDVWITDVGPYGNVQLVGVPEPSTLVMLGIAAGGAGGLSPATRLEQSAFNARTTRPGN